MALLLLGTGWLSSCSEEETSAPAAPDTTGKGSVTLQPKADSRISSKPTFLLTFNGTVQTNTIVTGNASCTNDTIRLTSQESNDGSCVPLSVSYSDDRTVVTVTANNTPLSEGDYQLVLSGSIATSAGTLGDEKSFSYTVVFPYGGAIQNPLSLSEEPDESFLGEFLPGITDNPPRFNGPQGLATNGSSLYIADTYNGRLRHVDLTDPNLPVETLNYPSLSNESYLFDEPVDVTISDTHLYVLDQGFNRVISIPLNGGTPENLAGGGSSGFLDGSGISAQFSNPSAITNIENSLFIADTGNNNIRRIDLTTNQTTSLLESTPGAALSGGLNGPRDLTTDGSTLYIADTNNCAIKTIDLNACGELDNCTLSTFSPFSPANICNLTKMPMSVGTDSQYLYVGTSNQIERFPLSNDSYLNDQSTSEIFSRSAISPRGLTTDGQSLFYSEEGANRIVRLK